MLGYRGSRHFTLLDTFFDRTQNATFTWTATYGDSVYLYMSADSGQIFCEWPMADGQAAISSSLLSKLPAGTASATLQAEAKQTLDRGRWRITASALSYGSPADVTLR